MRCTCTNDRRWSLNAVDKRVSSLKQLELNVSTQEGIKYCCSLFLIFIFKMPPKPSKPIALTLEQRVEVVKKSEKNNLSARKIAEHFGVGRTQIDGILKRKAEVLANYDNNQPSDRKRQRKLTGNEDINTLVWKWFQDATARRINVSGPLIKEKALKFAEDLGIASFKASNGWLDSFRHRHNIVAGTLSGERGDVSDTAVEDWKSKLPVVCDGYAPKDLPLVILAKSKQLFNCTFQELADSDASVPTCEEGSLNWTRPTSELLKNFEPSQSSDDVSSDEESVDTTTVCSLSEAEKYVRKLKEFGLFHGKCDIVTSVMELQERVSNMRVENTCKQSKIHDFFSK